MLALSLALALQVNGRPVFGQPVPKAESAESSKPADDEWHLKGEHFGQRVLAFGDVDGDKIPDIAVSDFARDDRENGPGCVWIFSGKELKLITRLEGENQGKASARFGWALAAPGDLDGDGVPDLIVTARGGTSRWGEGDLHRTGYARVYSGKTWKILHASHAEQDMDGFGASVAMLGDLDGDGVPEIAVGADGSEFQREESKDDMLPGYVRVCSGKSGTLLRVIASETKATLFGRSVCGLPDLDGDGVPDLALGEPRFLVPGQYGGGRVRIYSMKKGEWMQTLAGRTTELDGWAEFGWSLARVGDLNADGVEDFAVGCLDNYVRVYSGGNLTQLLEINDVKRGMFVSGFADSICSVGDVTGDGVPDLAIGCEEVHDAGDAHDATVYSGQLGGRLLTHDTKAFFAQVGPGGDLAGTGVPFVLVGVWQQDRVDLVPLGKDAPLARLRRPVLKPK